MALELGEGLREEGVEMHFITSHWGNGEFGRRTQAAGFPTIRLWLGFISATLRLDTIRMTLDQVAHWPSLLLGFRRFLKRVKPSKVIHTNWHHVLLLWPLLRGDRDIFWLHEVLPNKRQYRVVFQKLSKRLESFVAVSQAAAESLEAIGVPEKKIRVIHNGITDEAGRVSYQEKNGSIIGIVGQIGEWKGHEDLFQALEIVIKSHPDVKLHVFGKGVPDYEEKLRRLASDLHVNDHVIWRGFVRSRSEIYDGMSILVVPSRSEDTLPTSAIEAALFSIPVIGSRRGGLPEIIEDGMTGYLFDVGDVDTLSSRLVGLLDNCELQKRLGANARCRAAALFSRERFISDFLEICRSPVNV
jgi:glycosyltransferase involved in cell wall biosynthesis